MIASFAIVYYLHLNPIRFTGEATQMFDSMGVEPIFTFSTEPGLFFAQALVVLIIALGAAVYPLLFVRKLKPVEALHS